MATAVSKRVHTTGGAVDLLPPAEVIFGTSAAMSVVRKHIEKVASSDIPVLLQGESGTGKDVLARYIHGRCSEGPFVKINCPAIPGTLLESELFGYEQGAFTGAYATKAGRVEMADRGTLFLDEISELDLALQSKLLHLLQGGHFTRIGGQEERAIAARVICATNRKIEEEVRRGSFRADLYYRISVVSVRVPSLRERREDIPRLVDHLLHIYAEKYNTPTRNLPSSTMSALQRHDWPGNIRELENVIRRYVILGHDDAFMLEAGEQSQPLLSDIEIRPDHPISLKRVTKRAVRDLERRIILSVLEVNGWNRKRTARALNISYRALLYKIRDCGLHSLVRPDPQEATTENAGVAASD